MTAPDHGFVNLRVGTDQTNTGMIPNAIAFSRGMMGFHSDPGGQAHKPEFNQDKMNVFFCASGGRSALKAQLAMDKAGGVGAWKKPAAHWSKSWTKHLETIN